ncbi:MAG TPA: DUF1893 domain-containing protein, partial [Alkalispirochaeta sp.]|nr:DUF1893 domain-containing protein [Alkalispirochaeta sp.]
MSQADFRKAPASESAPAPSFAPAPAPAPPVVLQLSRGPQVLYTDTGAWLHPLLNLTRFLGDPLQDPADHTLFDTIVGRAAALLIVRLGIRRVHTETMSRRGIPVFDRWDVAWSSDRVVDRIDCRTEEILADEHDPERA